MKRLVLLTVALLVCCATAQAVDVSVGVNLQRASVNIKAGRSQGSGVLFHPIIGGKKTTWVLTAHHVVDGLRKVSSVIDQNGDKKQKVTYSDILVVQERVNLEQGRGVGENRYYAKVIGVDERRDLAIARVRDDEAFTGGVTFYLEEQIPLPGTRLFHCGAPGGQNLGGTCSLTPGIISRLGVLIPDFGGSEYGVFDQVTCPALGGSSGGLVALADDGRVVGIITLGLRGADSFHWMVPVRSLTEYADEVNAPWLFDPSVEAPGSEKDISIPIELNPVTGTAKLFGSDEAD
jgi:S1-C subfamily serine protease